MKSIFVSKGYDDAWTSYNTKETWDLIANGFNKAGLNVLNDIIENLDNPKRAEDLDELIYPICFLFRHYLESRMKSIIVEKFGEEGSIKIIRECSHDLSKSWSYIKTIYQEQYGSHLKEDIIDQIEHYILEFNSIDPYSFSFRYPTSKDGNRSLPLSYISYSGIKESMELLTKSLDALYWTFYMIKENNEGEAEIHGSKENQC